LRPTRAWITVLQAGHLGDNVRVTIHRRAGIIELVSATPDIRTAAFYRPAAVGVRRRARQAWRPNIGIRPTRWQPLSQSRYDHQRKNQNQGEPIPPVRGSGANRWRVHTGFLFWVSKPGGLGGVHQRRLDGKRRRFGYLGW